MKNMSMNNFFLARLVHPPNTLLDFPPPPADQVMIMLWLWYDYDQMDVD